VEVCRPVVSSLVLGCGRNCLKPACNIHLGGLRPSLVMGFVDSDVNNLLLLEEKKEAAVVLAPIGFSNVSDSLRPDSSPIPAAQLPKVMPLSKIEQEYPEIWKFHEASSFTRTEQVTKWLSAAATRDEEKKKQVLSSGQSNEKLANEPLPQPNNIHSFLGDVILRRGSTRRFSRSAISRQQVSTILHGSTRGVPVDFLNEEQSMIDTYLIANAVEGLVPGRYFYDHHDDSLHQIATRKELISRNESGYLCLGQSLFSDASVVFFLMTNLASVLNVLGNRGYRATQFEAGVIAGKIYLNSYALGLGASGTTFFDDAVTELFSPNASDKATMLAVGIGVRAYDARPGKVLAARLTRSELAAEYAS